MKLLAAARTLVLSLTAPRMAQGPLNLRGEHSRTRLLASLTLALVYYATAELSRRFAVTPQNVTPIWPPDGFAMAGVILGGLWLWPGVFLGSFLANIGAFAQTGSVFLNLLSILKVGHCSGNDSGNGFGSLELSAQQWFWLSVSDRKSHLSLFAFCYVDRADRQCDLWSHGSGPS